MEGREKVFLIKDRRAVSFVYLPENSSERFRQAAAELVRICQKATGVKIPINNQVRTAEKLTRIEFSVRPARRKKSKLPPDDTFWIFCQKDKLEISVTREEMLGVALARFLEEATGARWFFPGKLGEDIPERKEIFFLQGKKRFCPSFTWRSLSWKDGSVFRDWQEKNGLFPFPVNRGHAYTEILPRELFRTHPEFFSLICGQRRLNPSQMCYQAPGIVELTCRYIEQVLEKNPELVAVSLCPNDVDYFCECSRCQRGEKPTRYYDHFVHQPPYGYGGPGSAAHLSERVFRFTNKVAKKLKEKHPDKYLIVYAYGCYRQPPQRIKISDNVIIWLTTTCLGWWNKKRRRLDIERMKAWQKVARNIVIFEALSNQAWPELPRIAPALVADSLKTYHRFGIQGFYSQMFGDFGTNLPNYYLATRFLWNTRASYKKEWSAFLKRCFGQAASQVAKYWKILSEAWKKLIADGTLEGARSIINPHYEYLQLVRLYPEETIEKARTCLQKAREMSGQGIHRKRVEMLEKGWRYTELTLKAVKECLALEDLNFPPFYFSPWLAPDYDFRFYKILVRGMDKRVVIHALKRAISTWEEREKFVRRCTGKYILSPTLLERNRRFDPRPILKKMLQIAEEMKKLSENAGNIRQKDAEV